MKRNIKKIINFFIIIWIFIINRFLDKIKKKQNSEINILFIIGKIGNGGAERACVNLAEELNKKYNVTIAIFNQNENEYECKVPIINIGSTKNNLINRIVKILKIKKENRITHTISLLIIPNCINVITKRYDKAIISVRNYMSESNKDKKNIFRHKFACKFADKIVCVSEDVRKDQIENWKINIENCITIPNFVDKEKIKIYIKNGKVEVNEEKIFSNSKVVISIGRLVEQKGHKHLIKAFKYVVKEVPEAQLIILGDGELRTELMCLIDELDLKKNITLLGFKKNPYIYMSKSQIFVLTSYYEGMSNVILEAMESKLPIIATDSRGGNREVLINANNEFGILVPLCKTDEEEQYLALKIIEFLKNEELRSEYINKSIQRIEEYSKENIINRWEDLIND